MYQQNQYVFAPVYDPSADNYRKLRKHSVFVGCCFLANFLVQEIMFLILMLLGLDDDYYSNPAFQYASGALFFSIIAMGVPFYIYSCRKGRMSYKKALPFHTPQPFKKIVCLILAGFGFCIISSYVASFAGSLLSFAGIEEYVPDEMISSDWLDVLMNFVCAAVVAPLVEEYIFRGVIMQPLRKYGDGFAVIASSVLFALAHGRPTNIIFAFGAGVAIGFAVIYSRSLWVGIIIHALNNGFSVFFGEMYYVSPDVSDLIYIIACIAVVIVGIVSFVVFSKSYGLKLQPNLSGVKSGKRVFGFFVTVPVILAFIYFVYVIYSNIQ